MISNLNNCFFSIETEFQDSSLEFWWGKMKYKFLKGTHMLTNKYKIKDNRLRSFFTRNKNMNMKLSSKGGFVKIFIYLVAPGLCCSIRDLQLKHVGSSSLTRDTTWASCTRSTESQLLDHQGCPKTRMSKDDDVDVQLFSRISLFATLWIAARQASLSLTNFQSLSKDRGILKQVTLLH